MDKALPRGSETLLVVDDEEELRTTTARMLESLGYEVLQAGSAEQALDLAATFSFHLLLMDVILPQMSGLSLAHKIQVIRPGIRVLYFSAYTSGEVLDDRFERRPGVGFIQKPFTAGDMAESVRNLLDEPRTTPSPPNPTPRGTETVLVVDTDPQTRRFIAKALERLGYHILEAQDPERALSIALKSRVDLVVADVVLPGLSGPAMREALSTEKRSLPFLFVSDQARPKMDPAPSPEGAAREVLMKPFSASELGEAVRRVLEP